MTELSQKLQARHVNMIALGGSIGTGIFLASGYAISVGGPGGALTAYAMMSLIVYFLMTSLGEMTTYKPSAGSLCDYSTLYVGKSFGFAMGYNYWFNWAITVAAEICAAAMVMHYWFPDVASALFVLLFFSIVFILNIFSVNVYGEMEYWLSLIKIVVIILFVLLGLAALSHKPHFGVNLWTVEDGPFHGGWLGFMTVFLFAGFSFQGSELVGVASGETQDPHLNIPKSIRRVFWRLCLFYILSMLVISLLIPFNDPRLLNQNSVTTSPYTLVFNDYLSHYAGAFINFVILVALLSAANASLYSSTRILWYLGKNHQAPSVFAKVTSKGVPLYALLLTSLIGATSFLAFYIKNGVLFSYLLQISALMGFIAWLGIALSHYLFRKKYLPKHGGVEQLVYKAKFYPYAQILSMIVIVFIIGAQFLTSGQQTLLNELFTYASVILFGVTYSAHKLFHYLKNKSLTLDGG